ncbi:MAG: hypothetical protein R3B84_14005 [Zavarzinella sp.]
MNLFVAVSTGSQVSNLPPILEMYQPGDKLLWIESPESKKGNWATKASELLTIRGLSILESIDVGNLNDRSEVLPAISSWKQNYKHSQKVQYYLVLNGGTKWVPLWLLEAFRDWHPKLLYGSDRPATYMLQSLDFASSPIQRAYQNNCITLQEVLYLKGFELFQSQDTQDAVQVWPGTATIENSTDYGTIESTTYQLHQEHFDYRKALQSQAIDEKHDIFPKINVPFQNLNLLVRTETFEKWQQQLKNFVRNPNPQFTENLFHGTANLYLAAARKQLEKMEGIISPTSMLGPPLENAITHRIIGWLNQNKDIQTAVASIWKNVKICRLDNKSKAEAELDIVILLKCGKLIYLECKAAKTDSKDIDAGSYRLQQASSTLAEQFVVLPIYTRKCDTPWFQELHNERMKLGRQAIPFTMPGQPESYPMIDANGASEENPCPSFEESLEKLLKPYCL